MKNIFLTTWLPLVATGTIVLGVTYFALQQNMRQNANDPQISIAEDAATLLAQGVNPANLIAGAHTDMSKSLSPFIMTFDDMGSTTGSSGFIGDTYPIPPAGVIAYAHDHGENRLTWQPAPGVRLAAVVVHYSGVASGSVLVARNIREVESRENQLTMIIGLAWLVMIVVVGVLVALPTWFMKKAAQV